MRTLLRTLSLAATGLGLAVLGSACSAPTTTGAGSTAPSTTALGTQSSSTTAAAASAALSAKALGLTADMVSGNFSAVSSQFDATMSAGLSTAALEAAWQQVAGPLGAYKGHAAPIFKVLTPGYQTFFIPTDFRSGSIEVQLAFDSRAKVAGLYLRPPGFDQGL